jgi:hypothetical protein
MQQVAELAEQVRQYRQPVAPDNPLVQVQAKVSEAIVGTLERYGQMKDSSFEQMFLALYGSPLLQAMLGMRASEEPPRRHPGIEPERMAFVQQRIAEIRARVAEGGMSEAAIRSLVYIGMAGPGVDERAFNELRLIRADHGNITLQQFKQMLREQFFALLLDRDAALAAIPKMLPADAASRAATLGRIRRIVSAVGEPGGERAERLAQIEKLFGAGPATGRSRKAAPRKPAAARKAASVRARKRVA